MCLELMTFNSFLIVFFRNLTKKYNKDKVKTLAKNLN